MSGHIHFIKFSITERNGRVFHCLAGDRLGGWEIITAAFSYQDSSGYDANNCYCHYLWNQLFGVTVRKSRISLLLLKRLLFHIVVTQQRMIWLGTELKYRGEKHSYKWQKRLIEFISYLLVVFCCQDVQKRARKWKQIANYYSNILSGEPDMKTLK